MHTESTQASVPILDDVAQRYHALEEHQRRHPLWRTPLLRAFTGGTLTRDDLRFIFGQYYFYSRAFTRYLAALMARSEDDLLRARLSANLWEEGGGCEPEQRHSELFRKFLRTGMGIEDPEATTPEACTRAFVQDYLRFCDEADPVAACAFLALGTESIVPRLYTVFLEGLRSAGVDEELLSFFRLHVECDDDHAETLAQMLRSYAARPDWSARCEEGMTHALNLRETFFHELFACLQQRRVANLLVPIQTRMSLATGREEVFTLGAEGASAERLYRNRHERLNIDFEVERLPFASQVLDTRLVRIQPGKFNERHRHAHESVFQILSGRGQVLIDDKVMAVDEGDTVFVPRWCMHQTQNTGSETMLILAITDFGLTGRAFIGNYNRTARLKEGNHVVADDLAASSAAHT